MGSVVAIEGVPHPAAPLNDPACTSLLCPSGNECCEACRELGQGYEIRTAKTDATFRVYLPIRSCRKESCRAWASSREVHEQTDCTPFGRAPTTTYRFVGKLVSPPWYFPRDSWLMEIERFCPASVRRQAASSRLEPREVNPPVEPIR
jgi:hypothetical protein